MKQLLYSKNFPSPSRISSIRNALNGCWRFLLQEPNARIHAVSTFLAMAAIFLLPVSRTEIIAIVIVTALVWITEIINTAIETIMDHLSPGYHPLVGYIKDLSAGAVLLAAFTAVVTGAIIFLPKIL